jgi:hypothetical protein
LVPGPFMALWDKSGICFSFQMPTVDSLVPSCKLTIVIYLLSSCRSWLLSYSLPFPCIHKCCLRKGRSNSDTFNICLEMGVSPRGNHGSPGIPLALVAATGNLPCHDSCHHQLDAPGLSKFVNSMSGLFLSEFLVFLDICLLGSAPA